VWLIGAAGVAIAAIVVYGLLDDQPPRDIIAGVCGILLLGALVVLMPVLGKACQAEDRFWRAVGRRIRQLGNRKATLS
jgi:hypothetical protein